MSVLRKDLTRWERVVPYTAPPELHPMIEEFNEEVYGAGRFKLFVPHQGQPYYAAVAIGSGGDSEKSKSDIGCMKMAGQSISSVNDRFVLWHEMCHCLGFEHEQLHAKYPWDPRDNASGSGYLPPDPKNLRTDQNKTIGMTIDAFYDDATALGHAVAGLGGGSASSGRALLKPASVMNFLEALPIASDIIAKNGQYNGCRLQATQNIRATQFIAARAKAVDSRGDCDYDSIMMYKAYIAAGIAAYVQTGIARHMPYASGKTGRHLLLSNDDVRVIRELYPG